MSDTYTPTMNDVKHWLCEPPYAGGLFDDETAAKFDVALAAHDAEIAAKALSDMADELMLSHDGGRRDAGAHSKSAASSAAQKRAMQQVRARAAEYRKAVQAK